MKTGHVAFVCLHGSAKSLIAAEYLNRRAIAHGLELRATASGREPDPEVPPHVVEGLREKGFDVAGRTPRLATRGELAAAALVIGFGCPITDVVAAGTPCEEWADCPAVSEDFGAAWRFITARVDRMLGGAGFDQDAAGAPPAGWSCGVTGTGSPRWTVEADPTAPSPPHVLRQSGSGTFPWCVRPDVKLADGFVEVRFKPIAGNEDRAGGVVWRWKGRDDYYVARANALEDNVSLYYTEDGKRRTLKYVDARVAAGAWHTLRVEFRGDRIAVDFDGRRVIEMEDRHIEGAGGVGVWTKADSVTAFDDFAFGPPP